MRARRTDIVPADTAGVARAARLIRRGETVAFPTETVYGLGADALNAEAVKRIFAAKGRPADNPLIVHCADVEMLRRIVAEVPPVAERLLAELTPGPLTLVLKKAPQIPGTVTAGLNTVAARIPAHAAALALIRAAGTPIAAPSANSSGRPSPTAARHVYDDLNGKIPLILDGGLCGVGVESTVLDLSGAAPAILRPGGCPAEKIEALLGFKFAAAGKVGTGNAAAGKAGIEKAGAGNAAAGNTAADCAGTEGSGTGKAEGRSDAPKSPGMKYRHYAPACEVRVFGCGNVSEILKAYDECVQKNLKSAIITIRERQALYGGRNIVALGRDGADAARALFGAFRAAERDCDVLLCEELPEVGLGRAVNDRMRRAAAGGRRK
ncbi:MAG: threonylcarbamoyl-AMP synthase [Clostridiales bacterium]|nr:threonylcarbamoyl-AMP synthase [Clostridiales bacterium]